MILLQVPPGTDELIKESLNITPYTEKVYGYLILVLIVANAIQASVVIFLYRGKEKLHERMTTNSIEQTKTFTELNTYFEDHEKQSKHMTDTIDANKNELMRLIRRIGIKIQNNEKIDPDP